MGLYRYNRRPNSDIVTYLFNHPSILFTRWCCCSGSFDPPVLPLQSHWLTVCIWLILITSWRLSGLYIRINVCVCVYTFFVKRHIAVYSIKDNQTNNIKRANDWVSEVLMGGFCCRWTKPGCLLSLCWAKMPTCSLSCRHGSTRPTIFTSYLCQKKFSYSLKVLFTQEWEWSYIFIKWMFMTLRLNEMLSLLQ